MHACCKGVQWAQCKAAALIYVWVPVADCSWTTLSLLLQQLVTNIEGCALELAHEGLGHTCRPAFQVKDTACYAAHLWASVTSQQDLSLL